MSVFWCANDISASGAEKSPTTLNGSIFWKGCKLRHNLEALRAAQPRPGLGAHVRTNWRSLDRSLSPEPAAGAGAGVELPSCIGPREVPIGGCPESTRRTAKPCGACPCWCPAHPNPRPCPARRHSPRAAALPAAWQGRRRSHFQAEDGRLDAVTAGLADTR